MPSFDPTVASPSPTAGGAVDQMIAGQIASTAQIKGQAGMTQKFLTNDYTKYQIPQLKSQVAAAGQNYSSAKINAEGQAQQGFLHSSYDIQSGMASALNDLQQQRMYATLGLVIGH